MRGAGDLVARMQMSKGMRIEEAKAYVAKKLLVGIEDLTDPVIMNEVRTDLGIGVMTPLPGFPKGIEAKFNIAKVLDIDIACVNRFKSRTS
nr:[dimethylamine--corrinoid protein] Co-methyltransferase [Candidatus Desulfobacula maris]